MKRKREPPALISLDMDNLDKEWAGQPEKVHRFGLQMADAKSRMALKKAALDLAEAEIKLDVRKHPERYGLKRASDDTVKDVVKTEEGYQNALLEYNKSRHDVDVLQAALEALDHKKYGLRDIVQLTISGFYAEVKPPPGSEELVDNMVKRRTRSKGRSSDD